MMKFIDEARAYQDNMIEDLRELVKIESVRDDAACLLYTSCRTLVMRRAKQRMMKS